MFISGTKRTQRVCSSQWQTRQGAPKATQKSPGLYVNASVHELGSQIE